MHRTAIPNVYLKAYMHLLQKKGLIEYDIRKRVLRITEKIIRYLNLNNEINNLLV